MARELLRALRGQRSQVAFARRLGYKANPIADWEAGRRFPTALEMLRAYEKVTGDVAAAFARFHPSIPARLPDGTWDLGSWLSALRGSASVQDIAHEPAISSRSRAGSGSTRRAPDFLRVLDAITGAPRISSPSSAIDVSPRRTETWSAASSPKPRARGAVDMAILRVIESSIPSYPHIRARPCGRARPLARRRPPASTSSTPRASLPSEGGAPSRRRR